MADPQIIGAFDAKTHLSELLERVSAGESFLITRRGVPVARLTPAAPTAQPLTTAEILASARRLRAEVGAHRDELRDWVDEGRA